MSVPINQSKRLRAASVLNQVMGCCRFERAARDFPGNVGTLCRRLPRWLLMGVLAAAPARATPFLPREDGQVLERLRTSSLDPDRRALRELRHRLTTDPNNLSLASQFVRRAIEVSRREGDPRYLGRAQSALAPWWGGTNAPAEALVLRAIIRQAQHDFGGALSDLDLALQATPANGQAWLTRTAILTVLGKYPAAKRACVPLAQLAPGLVALTAAANVSCLEGNAERGCALLRSALSSYPDAAQSERIWALTILGEAAARLGREAEAEEHFQEALKLDPRDSYLQGAYADLLLDQIRIPEVLALLKDATRTDGLLLRIALAEAQLDPRPPQFASHVNTLLARFEAGHLRGDFVHLREEARFVLHLQRRPAQALKLAEANWGVQHEPADARILLECAAAAHNPIAARPVLEFLRENRLQDVQLSQLTRILGQQNPE